MKGLSTLPVDVGHSEITAAACASGAGDGGELLALAGAAPATAAESGGEVLADCIAAELDPGDPHAERDLDQQLGRRQHRRRGGRHRRGARPPERRPATELEGLYWFGVNETALVAGYAGER
jgi:hypothetical protein